MRLWIAIMLCGSALGGYAQESAPEEIVKAEEDESGSAAIADSHKGDNSGGCGCGKPKS